MKTLPLVAALAVFCGCAHYRNVQQPPAFALTSYPAIGVFELTSSQPQPGLQFHATQRLMQQLTQAQPGIRVMQLGPLGEALASVGKNRLDADAVRALGQKFNVPVFFAGNIEITQPEAHLSVGALLESASVNAEVTTTLSASLYDSTSGGVLWGDSASGKGSAGGFAMGGGGIAVGGGGENHAYHKLIDQLTYGITEPFRAHWVRVRVED